MAMVKFDVDTSAKLFIAKAGVTSFDVKVDLYSDAKEHWIVDDTANKFNFPIRAIGGDPIGGGRFAGDFYFLRDGWKIRPQEADHTLTIEGNLYLDDGEVGGIVVPTVGDFTVLTTLERSNLTQTVETGSGGTDWTTTERAQIRHRLGLDGTTNNPAATPSLAKPGDAMSLTSGERTTLASTFWSTVIEGAVTAQQGMRRMFAALFGRTAGVGTTTENFKSLDGTKNRVTMDYDGSGNRTNPSFDDT
jgi:hypothetical protein